MVSETAQPLQNSRETTVHLLGDAGDAPRPVTLVAGDFAPSRALLRVAEKLAAKARVHAFIRQHEPIGALETDLAAVMIGMSSSEELAAAELAAGYFAIEHHIPLAVFADIEPTVGRPFFADLRPHVALVAVVNERARANAQKLFPAATVVAAGNPLWEDFFRPRYSRDEIRSQFEVPAGIPVLLVPSGKDEAINRLHFTGVASAVAELGREVVVIVSLHPGLTAADRDMYASIFSGIAARVVHRETDGLTSDDLIAGADVVIPSASTIGVAAACQRVPVVNYFTEAALDRLERATGSREWPAVRDGTELLVIDDPKKLAEITNGILDGKISLSKAQENIFPRPVTGAAEAIAEAIRSIAKH